MERDVQNAVAVRFGLSIAALRLSAIQKASGVTGVMLTAAGTYRVSFNRDISLCAVVATPFSTTTTIAASVSTNIKQDVIVYALDSTNHLSDFSIAAFR